MKTYLRTYWAAGVIDEVVSDIERLDIPPALADEMIEQFLELADLEYFETDKRITNLKGEGFQGRTFRFRFNGEAFHRYRGLVMTFKISVGEVLILNGVFERSPETYHGEMQERCRKVGR